MLHPSFQEDHISQLPALQLLIKLGWRYLTPVQALAARGGRSSDVLLEGVLQEQLARLNVIRYKRKEYAFSEANLLAAVHALKNLPLHEGYQAANAKYYDLVTLGKSFSQVIEGDRKDFSMRFVDWEQPDNNVFHVTEECSVLRSGRNDHYRPDLVLYVNGIPMVVIECKSSALDGDKKPVDLAVEQHLRNQQDDGIRELYLYSNLLLALAVHENKYATTGTPKEFWGVWKENYPGETEQNTHEAHLEWLKNHPLSTGEKDLLFSERFRYVRQHFDALEREVVGVTEQDRLLYHLCRKERLLDLIYNFTLFDNGEKKIARYQQFFAIHRTLDRILTPAEKSKALITNNPSADNQSPIQRNGGVIWHTQGSGKSLTMVMLAQLIAQRVGTPKILLVTDRIDLDDQITDTFKKCGVEVQHAESGEALALLLASDKAGVITTVIHKFEKAVNNLKAPLESPDVFVLIDEGHRSQYGSFNVKMRKALLNACFIAFTGTPLMKSEKSTATKFGGIIDVYSIRDAVDDKAVVPLLYEGRHNLIDVNARPLNSYFDKVAEPLTDYGKAELKRKFSTVSAINKADQVIYARAWDISEHFAANWQGTGFKGQLVAPNKAAAIRYKKYMDEIGKVNTAVIISPPDEREGTEDAYEETTDEVLKFWKAMMDKHGANYEKNTINAFKKSDQPEILIVVDKLLTGFDAPNNRVLYLTRPLKEHTLLQAIARVNRVAEGKDNGIIIDYYGNLENLDSALDTYSGLDEFDREDLEGTLTNIGEEVKKLPQAHSEVWDIFKTVRHLKDAKAYEDLLYDEALRHAFYEKLSVFARLLKLALSSLDFCNNTPESEITRYKHDAQFFLKLRVDVKRRYFDAVDYSEYEKQVQKLIDRHITTEGEVLRITDLVNIFDKAQRDAELEKLASDAARADHIASRTAKAIELKMDEDPVFYKDLARLIREAIEAYHQHRLSEAEYLKTAHDLENRFFSGKQSDLPGSLEGKAVATALFNQVKTHFPDCSKEQSATLALLLESIFRRTVFEDGQLIVDWHFRSDLEGDLRRDLGDTMYDYLKDARLSADWAKIDDAVEECWKVGKSRFK